MYLYLYTL